MFQQLIDSFYKHELKFFLAMSLLIAVLTMWGL